MNFRQFSPRPHGPVRIALFFSILILAAAPVPLTQAQESNRDTPSVIAQSEPGQAKPIPLGWKIAGVATVAIGIGFVLAYSLRAWRSSNLFDREYRFPAIGAVAFRLGGNKSGGCMSIIEFGGRPVQGPAVFNRRL